MHDRTTGRLGGASAGMTMEERYTVSDKQAADVQRPFGYPDAGEGGVRDSATSEIIQRVGRLTQIVQANNERLDALRSLLYGPLPTGISGSGQKDAVPAGVIAQIDMALSALEAQVEANTSHIAGLRHLV